MKKLILSLILTFALSTVDSQGQRGKFTLERFQAELEQYITKKAGLTPKEASQFFPVYSEMLSKQRAIHKDIKNLKRIKPVTDLECQKNIRKRDELDMKMKELQKKYHEKFMQILPPKKVYDILKAEDRFHRQMFKRAADRRRKKR